nr:MAG TPA: hypothetical protein [Caudoviricetes sp.]
MQMTSLNDVTMLRYNASCYDDSILNIHKHY